MGNLPSLETLNRSDGTGNPCQSNWTRPFAVPRCRKEYQQPFHTIGLRITHLIDRSSHLLSHPLTYPLTQLVAVEVGNAYNEGSEQLTTTGTTAFFERQWNIAKLV